MRLALAPTLVTAAVLVPAAAPLRRRANSRARPYETTKKIADNVCRVPRRRLPVDVRRVARGA